MFIHIWMHWFWITAAYLKGFLVFTISLSCISEPHFAEAGLLDNDTFTPHPYNRNDSSQTLPGITSPILIPPDPQPTPTVPQEDATTEEPTTTTTTTTRPDDGPRPALPPAGDVSDTHNGGILDAVQYPLKKFTKHSHPKYGKTWGKGKQGDEAGGETVKIVEEKVNISISIGEEGRTDVDNRNDSLGSDGGTSEVPGTEAPDSISTTVAPERGDTPDGLGGESPGNGTRTRDPAGDREKEAETPKNETLVIESKVEGGGEGYTTVEPFLVKNRVAAATSAHNYEVEQSELNAGSITGITLGILVVFSLFGAVSFVLYRRRYLNKPEVLHDKCSNLDSSGYIDETSLRENSEEMYSLDNDSFLNSLEAMTIQNYWTESVKHTKL